MNSRAGAGDRRHLEAVQTDGSRADDHDDVAGTDPGSDHQGVVGHAGRFRDGGFFEGEGFGDTVQDLLTHLHEPRKGAMGPGAIPKPTGTHLVFPGPAEVALSAHVGRRLANDPIADLPPLDGGACLLDDPAELVPHDDRRVHRVGVVVAPHLDVASTDPHCLDTQEHVVVRNGRDRDVAKLDLAVLLAVLHHRLHGLHENPPSFSAVPGRSIVRRPPRARVPSRTGPRRKPGRGPRGRCPRACPSVPRG